MAIVGRRGIGLTLLTIALAAIAWKVFPLSQPTIALDQRLTRDVAITTARTFADRHALVAGTRRVAVRFSQSSELQTFIELDGGGKAAVDREVAGKDVALFEWSVRLFEPGDVHDTRVTLAPDGRVIGFDRRLADTDVRPALDSAAAARVADDVLATWLGLPPASWHLISASISTVSQSGRVDRSFTYERSDRKIAKAPLRLAIKIQGNTAGAAEQYVVIPEAFSRRYGEMRSANDLLANIAAAVVPLYLIAAFIGLGRVPRRRRIDWRPALIVGAVMGLFMLGAGLNDIPGGWFGYDTAESAGTYLARQWFTSAIAGVGMWLAATLLVAAGAELTRDAFPSHYDWWRSARDAATPPVAARLLGAYTLAAFGFAYVSLFYLATSRGLGWWSPASLLDDPDRIATPLPWISAIAQSLQAGVLEEIIFRAVPLALLSRWAGTRPARPVIMAGGVVGTALVFGFAHANYPSWPAYARGVELFLEASLWAVIYLRVGLPTTIIAHFTYDLVLFGLFAAAGNAWPYRITAGVIALAIATPAMVVFWHVRRARGWRPASEARHFGDRVPPAPMAAPIDDVVPARDVAHPLPRATAAVAIAVGVAAIMIAVAAPSREPRFTVDRARALVRADSVVRALGGTTTGWLRVATTDERSGLSARRFVLEQDPTGRAARRFDAEVAAPGAWHVQYMHVQGSVAERAEAWDVELDPAGGIGGWSHTLPETTTVAAVAAAVDDSVAARSVADLARHAVALRTVNVDPSKKPNRLERTYTFEDTLSRWSGGAELRYGVTASGGRVLGVSRGLRLPEAWRRHDRETSSRRGFVGSVVSAALLTVFLVGFVRVVRRPVRVTGDPMMSRRHALMAFAAAAALGIASEYNEWPARLAGYDTAQDWGRFLGQAHLGAVASGLAVLMAFALWVGVDAVRRRIPVPTWGARREVILAGAGLAGAWLLLEVPGRLLLWKTGAPISTALGALMPAFSRATEGLTAWRSTVPLIAIAGGIVAAHGRRARALFAWALLAGTAVLVVASGADTDSEWGQRVVLGLVTAAGAAWIVARLGGRSVASWLFAGAIVDAMHQVVVVSRSVHSGDVMAAWVGVGAAVASACAIALAAPVHAPPIPSVDALA